MGLDLGDNYDNYINNPEAKKITPSKEMVQDLIHAREKENELLIKDFYLTIDMYKENKEILENKDFLVKHGSSFIYKSYNEKCWCVNFNIKITDDMVDGVTTVHPISDTVTLHPILLFNSNVKPYYFDYNLIHELNHILEYKIVDYIITKTGKNNNIDIYVESGFDFIFDGYLVPKLDKRKYEVFNEVINDLFSVDITNLMHSKGIYLFTEKKDKDCNKYGFSVYEYGKPLLRDFFNFYKEELKYARLTGIKTELFNTIGEDNFNELNDLINEFYIYFDCIHGESQKIEKTLDNINAGIETKDTRKYNDFIEMSQVILEQMKDYKNVYKRKLAA